MDEKEFEKELQESYHDSGINAFVNGNNKSPNAKTIQQLQIENELNLVENTAVPPPAKESFEFTERFIVNSITLFIISCIIIYYIYSNKKK